jgi:hypothetical protein
MPLLRYFIFVGGSLLALLLVVNATLPAEPLLETSTSGSDLPPVRIHSDRKLPDRVVFDTSAILPGHTQAAPVVVARAKPQLQVATQVQTRAQGPVPPAMAEMSAKERVREAFAQLPQEDDASQPTMTDMATVVVPEPKMYPARQPVKHKLVARPRNTRPMMVAQQPRSGGFFTW